MDINQELFKRIQNKKAVIWDFDGVIMHINWEFGEGVDAYWKRLWKFLEGIDPDIKKVFEGRTEHYTQLDYPYEHTDYLARKYGQTALDKINAFYLEKELSLLPESPVNKELVSLIKGIYHKTGQLIWSNNEGLFIKKGLEKAGIADRFKAIVSRDRVLLAKPDLGGFELIRPLVPYPAEDFIFVGDSPKSDGTIAKALKMEFFHYPSF